MAQLTNGARVGVMASPRAARIAFGARAVPVRVNCGVVPVSFRLSVRAGALPAVGGVRSGSLRIVPGAGATRAAWGGRHGRSLAINRRPLGPKIAGIREGRGPGSAAGEFLVPLPAVWLDQEYPVGCVGRDLAALALLRGESWALSGGVLSVGGRVVIAADGSDIIFSDGADVEDWIADRYAELARYLGALGLPQGARRDAVLSRYRRLAAVAVRAGSKFVGAVGDPVRRSAMVADLRWIERRV